MWYVDDKERRLVIGENFILTFENIVYRLRLLCETCHVQYRDRDILPLSKKPIPKKFKDSGSIKKRERYNGNENDKYYMLK